MAGAQLWVHPRHSDDHGARQRSGCSQRVDGHRRLGGISNLLAKEIESRTGFESRVTIIGHVQRGGTPTAFDRVLATRLGMGAIDAVHEGSFGQMVALQGDRIVLVPLADAVRRDMPKAVPHELSEVGEVFCR